MKITGRYFAMAYKDGPLALTVERTSEPGESVTGRVVNGGWTAVFSDESIAIDGMSEPQEADLVWQGAELPEGEREDYGFNHVMEQLKGGYTLD